MSFDETEYLLFDDFSSQGLLHGKAPKIGPGGITWQEKNGPTSDPIGGPILSPGFSVVTADGLTGALAGTVSVASGGTAVTGAGTSFTSQLNVGTTISIETVSGSYTVSAIAGDTSLTISAPASSAATLKPFTAVASSYNILQLADTPGEIGFTFTLADNSHTYTPTAAIWPGGGSAAITGNLHGQVGNTLNLATLNFFTAYFLGGSGIKDNTWNDAASGFATVNFTPGMVYTFRIFIEAPWVYQVLLDATGNVVARQQALISQINGGAFLGPWLYLQTFTFRAGIVYRSIWARKKSKNSLNIRSFLGGIDNTPIGMRGPSSGRFTSVLVGSGAPAGPNGAPANPSPFTVTYTGHPTEQPGVHVKSLAPATGAELWLSNSLSTTAKIILDSTNGFKLVDNVGTEWFGKRNNLTPFLRALPNYLDDAAAAAGGVGIGELYVTGSIVKQRQA